MQAEFSVEDKFVKNGGVVEGITFTSSNMLPEYTLNQPFSQQTTLYNSNMREIPGVGMTK